MWTHWDPTLISALVHYLYGAALKESPLKFRAVPSILFMHVQSAALLRVWVREFQRDAVTSCSIQHSGRMS
jgi:hypothetical protein